MKNISLNELIHFFEFAEEKGLLKRNTARSNKAVVMRVCSVLDKEEQNHISEIPAEEIYNRFKTKNAADLSAESLRVYKSRFLSALEVYKDWQKQEHHDDQHKEDLPILADHYKRAAGGLKRLTLAEIPIAMGDGSQVKISNLPQDLSYKEAERIKRIVDAYVRSV